MAQSFLCAGNFVPLSCRKNGVDAFFQKNQKQPSTLLMTTSAFQRCCLPLWRNTWHATQRKVKKWHKVTQIYGTKTEPWEVYRYRCRINGARSTSKKSGSAIPNEAAAAVPVDSSWRHHIPRLVHLLCKRLTTQKCPVFITWRATGHYSSYNRIQKMEVFRTFVNSHFLHVRIRGG